MMIDSRIESIDDLGRGYINRDGFIFKALDHPRVFDAIVIKSPSATACPLYYQIRPERSIDEHIEFINKYGVKKAVVLADDISFLANCNGIEAIELIAIGQKGYDFSALYSMPKLRYLRFPIMPSDGIATKEKPDYAKLGALEELYVCDIAQGLTDAKSLCKLSVTNVKKNCDNATALFSSEELVELSVMGCGIKNLSGIDQAKRLETLQLRNNKMLTDVGEIRKCAATLKNLTIANCAKITDFSFLHDLRELENLELYGSNDIESLSFLKDMPKLKVFNFGINVVDGDITPCLNVPLVNMEKARKHYNLKANDLKERTRIEL